MAVKTFEELVGAEPESISSKTRLPSFEELVGTESEMVGPPEPTNIPANDYFVGMPAQSGQFQAPARKQNIPFIPPFGGIYAQPQKDYLAEAGLPEMAKAFREMAAPTTPYTEKESRQAFEQIPRALEHAGMKVIPSWIAGPLAGMKPSEWRAGLQADLEENVTAGLAPALAQPLGETVQLAIEWGIVYPALFAGVGKGGEAVARIPQVSRGIEALKSLGGVNEIAVKFPRLYARTRDLLKAFSKGATVGAITSAPEPIAEKLPAGETIKHIGKNAAVLGGIAAGFQAVSEVDTSLWVNKYRKLRLKAHNELFNNQLNILDAEIKRIQSISETNEIAPSPRYEDFTNQPIAQWKAGQLNRLAGKRRTIADKKIRDLRNIDTEVATRELELRKLKSNKLYQKGQELVEKPDVAVKRQIEALKVGLGKSEPFIQMPTTRAGEIVETLKGQGQVAEIPKPQSAAELGLTQGEKGVSGEITPQVPMGQEVTPKIPQGETPVEPRTAPTPPPIVQPPAPVQPSQPQPQEVAPTGTLQEPTVAPVESQKVDVVNRPWEKMSAREKLKARLEGRYADLGYETINGIHVHVDAPQTIRDLAENPEIAKELHRLRITLLNVASGKVSTGQDIQGTMSTVGKDAEGDKWGLNIKDDKPESVGAVGHEIGHRLWNDMSEQDKQEFINKKGEHRTQPEHDRRMEHEEEFGDYISYEIEGKNWAIPESVREFIKNVVDNSPILSHLRNIAQGEASVQTAEPKKASEITPEQHRQKLYEAQNTTLEHKFPIKDGNASYFEEAAGDIFREMTKEQPAESYITEKIRKLKKFIELNKADVDQTIRAKAVLKERELANYENALKALKDQLDKADVGERKQVMTDAIGAIENILAWFKYPVTRESMSFNKTMDSINKLETSINDFFGVKPAEKPQEPAIPDRVIMDEWQKLIAGKKVIMSDESMDRLQELYGASEEYKSLKSIKNPNQIGTKDQYEVWIEAPTPESQEPEAKGETKAQTAAKTYRKYNEKELENIPSIIWDEIEIKLADALKGEEELADHIINLKGRFTADFDNIIETANVLDYIADAYKNENSVSDILTYDKENGHLEVKTGSNPAISGYYTQVKKGKRKIQFDADQIESAMKSNEGMIALYDQIQAFLNEQPETQAAEAPAEEKPETTKIQSILREAKPYVASKKVEDWDSENEFDAIKNDVSGLLGRELTNEETLFLKKPAHTSVSATGEIGDDFLSMVVVSTKTFKQSTRNKASGALIDRHGVIPLTSEKSKSINVFKNEKQFLQIIQSHAAQESSRYAINGFKVEKNGDVASTDGRRLLVIKNGAEQLKGIGKNQVYSFGTAKGYYEGEGNFPKWQDIIPQDIVWTAQIKDTQAEQLIADIKLTKKLHPGIQDITGGADLQVGIHTQKFDQAFNNEYIREALEATIKLGAEDLFIRLSGYQKPILIDGFKAGKLISQIVIMPVSLGGSGKISKKHFDITGYLKKEPVTTLKPKAEPKEKPQKKASEKPKPPAPQKKEDIGKFNDINIVGLSNALEDRIIELIRSGPITNIDIKKEVAKLYGVDVSQLDPAKGYSHKRVQEAVESILVRYAREIITIGREQGLSREQIFNQLRTLYSNQPSLQQRTGKSISQQAYSTPAPLAYLASELIGITPEDTVYEPTAGTGMLTIGADPKMTRVNEIDDDRRKLLKAQGFREVTDKDATKERLKNWTFVVAMNPPFGSYEETTIDNYKLTKIEHIIAAHALHAMSEDGRAVMIIAAPKHMGEYSRPDWVFGNLIYKNYNVIADFELSGKLYSRQGAAWPVRIIAIEGKQLSDKSPPNSSNIRAKTWEEAYNIVEGILTEKQPNEIDVELPEGWSVLEKEGRWQVIDDNGNTFGEIVLNEDGSYEIIEAGEEEGFPETLGFPEEQPQKKINNLSDALKKLAEQARQKSGNKKTVRKKINVIRTTTRKKPTGITGVRGGGEKPASELPAIRKPAEKPTQAPLPEPRRTGKPTELPTGGEPTAIPTRPAAGQQRAGGATSGEQPVPTEPSSVSGKNVPTGKRPTEVKGETEKRGAERPEVSADVGAGETKGAEQLKSVGMVGLPVGQIQVPYKPTSSAPPAKENIPTYLAPHVEAGMERLAQEVGNIDDYVRNQLGYKDNQEMWEYLSSTQVDTVAMALDRLDKGLAFIVGHQTGVGKGRVAAAIFRREFLKGNKTLFFTVKADLYSDFYRDLLDVGMTEEQLKPLMMNADSVIRNQNNEIIFDSHGNRPTATKIIDETLKDGNYNLLLSTYSQINKENLKGGGIPPQRIQIAGAARQKIVIFDESHSAAGQSNTGNYIRDAIIPHASGVLFMSATYAKRPDNMILYGKTGILDAFDGDMDVMIQAIKSGQEPFQEIISAALARSNSYIRTELDFSGVKYETVVDSSNEKRDIERSDEISDKLRQIVQFDNMFAKLVVSPIKKGHAELKKRMGGVGTSVTHTGFFATAHNAIKQMLLCLKIDETVEMTKKALDEGKRVFIGLENTMESFLENYMSINNLKIEDEISDFDYREVLRTVLRNTLRYKKIYPNGDEEVVYVNPEDLPEYPTNLKQLYYDTLDNINKAELLKELPGSPIDEIVNKLEAAGYEVGEMTGRGLRLEPSGEGKYTIKSRSASEKNKTGLAYKFNNETMRIIIGNAAAAEGMSLHSSIKFKNKEQRYMLVVQPHADISKFVQMLGRINRTGQVENPIYNILMTALPAEIRPGAILEKKMRSLNANTSAKVKGAYQQEAIPDILNLYGDYLTARYVLDHPEILRAVGIGIDTEKYEKSMRGGGYHGPWHDEEITKRLTGKLALLPVEQQREYYNWIEPEFESLLAYLNQTDQNELISMEKDFKAIPISSRTIFVGEPGNIFQEPATLDKMSIVTGSKPMTTQEIQEYKENVYKKYEFIDKSHPVVSHENYISFIQHKADLAWEKYVTQKGKDKILNTEEEAYRRTGSFLASPNNMRTKKDSQGSPLVLLEIKNTFDQKEFKKNPAAPSAIKLVVAIPHSAKTLEMSLSHWASMENFYGNIAPHFNRPEDLREERYIVNGNIIAGMGVVAGSDSDTAHQGIVSIRPKVINYTMEDGTVRQGLLMPKNFSSRDLPTSVNLIPEAAVAYLMDGAAGIRHLRIGEARIYKHNDRTVYIEVPKSKTRGQKYYSDKGITDITGDFESRQQTMRAYFHSDKLSELLIYFKNKGYAIRSDDSDPETAREYNNTYRDKPEGRFEEEEGMAAPVSKRKIPVNMEAPKTTKAQRKQRDIISRRKIIQHLSKAFGIPIRGVATHRKKNPGWYNRRTRSIRLKHVNDISVGAHEIGHHIDRYINDSAADKFKHYYGIGAEILRLGKALYGKQRPAGSYKAEGYAEFIRGWLTGIIDVKKEAPRMLKFFEEDYLPNNPEIAEILFTSKDLIDKWREQGAEARFDSAIGRKLKSEDSLRRRMSIWWSKSFTDVGAPLERMLMEYLPERSLEFGTSDPYYVYAYLTQTEGARARTMVMENTIDNWGRKTGISLKEALKPVSKNIKEFTRYIVAARAINLEKREIHSGFDLEDSLYIFKKYDSKEFRKAALEVTEWNHRLLDYLVEAGALEEEAAEKMRELNPIYVPFMRMFAPGEIRGKSPKGVGRGLIRRGKGVYKIVGSDRPIDDILEMMIIQARRIIAVSHKSMVARALAIIEAKHEGLGGMLEKVPAPIKATSFNANQIKGQLAQLGIDVTPGALDDAIFTVFSNSPIYLGKEHIISIVINGKRHWYQVAPELYEILEDMDQFQLPKLLNIVFGKANRAMRLGATGIHAAFGWIRNPIRDALDTVPKARYARGPVASIKGMGKDLTTTGMAKALGFEPNQAAKLFIDSGGKISGYIGQDRTAIQHLKGEMLANTVAGFAIHTVKHPVHALREVFGIPETGLRIEEYEKALQDWMNRHQPEGGEPPPDALLYAFQMASDQTINYRRAGSYGRWLNSMVIFWNANAQDMSKVYRTFQDPKTRNRALLWGLSTLTLSSLGIWWLNKDEEWYKKLPPWEIANYIHIPVLKWAKFLPGVKQYKSDEEIKYILRLPVPFLMGHIFMSMPVSIANTLYKQDPKRMTEFAGEVFDASLKPLFEWPSLLAPYVDIKQNRNWAGRPIVPESLQNKLPEDQYLEYTTEFCKIMGKVFNVSPLKLEYALNAYSGGLYRRLSGTAEKIAGKESNSPSDWMIIGTLFVRDPEAPRQQLERFYQKRDLLNKKYNSKNITRSEVTDRRLFNETADKISELRKKLSEDKYDRKVIYGQITRELERLGIE